MKSLIPFLALAASISVTSVAQNASTGKSNLQAQTGRKGAEAIAGTGAKPQGKPQEPRVYYGGLLADLTITNKPTKPADVRYPVKPKPVRDNVYADPQTGTIKGFVIFAIQF